jgi:Protein of unknown function DUF86
MSEREPSVLLDDIRISIEKIQRYIAGLDEGSFLADEKTIDAVVRNLEIIGEAAKQLAAEEPTLGDSLAANSRLAQPHRAQLRGNRSETRLEHFANSDSEVGVSDRRVEITTIDGVRDSQSTRASCFVIPNIRVIRAICGCPALPLFVCIRD